MRLRVQLGFLCSEGVKELQVVRQIGSDRVLVGRFAVS